MTKRSFILYHDYAPQFYRLSDEQCGKLIKAIFAYEISGECPKLSSAAAMAFGFIQNALDENRKKFKDICKKRSEAAKKSHEHKNSANACNCKNSTALAADTDIETETETETVTVTESERENKERNTRTPKKRARGLFKNVFLSDSQYKNLTKEYGQEIADRAVNLLSTRIARDSNSKYKDENHYATIKSWVIMAVNEEMQREASLEHKKSQVSKKKPVNPDFDFDLDSIAENIIHKP